MSGLVYGSLEACSDATPKKTATPDAGYNPDPEPTDTVSPYPTNTTPTSTTTVPYDSGPPPSSSGCDTSLNLTQVPGCNHFIAGARACADNTNLQPYPFTTTKPHDVVTCNGTNASCVQHCTALCAHMPSGFPDECDNCAGKVDGTYCGTEMGSWQTKNNNLLVQCRSGVFQTSPAPINCINGCQSGAGRGTARCL
jgi:hypothetical protein